MADVEIKYNNATIASLNDSGTEVLETNGTFLTDDITVEYTKSGGGGGGTTHVSGRVLFGSMCYYTTPSGTITTIEPDPMTSQIDIDVLAGSMLVIFNASGGADTLSNATYSSTLSLGSRASYKYALFYQVS